MSLLPSPILNQSRKRNNGFACRNSWIAFGKFQSLLPHKNHRKAKGCQEGIRKYTSRPAHDIWKVQFSKSVVGPWAPREAVAGYVVHDRGRWWSLEIQPSARREHASAIIICYRSHLFFRKPGNSIESTWLKHHNTKAILLAPTVQK